MENQLQTIVKESGLETAKAQYILDKFQNFFEIAAEWEEKAKHIVVTDKTQTAEMQMARAGRLFLKEKRVAVEKARKELKEQALREGKAIDGIANVLKALIIPTEEYLKQQEQFVEIQQAKIDEQHHLEVERRMEEERIAKEKAEAEERERIRLENEQLKAEAIEREKKVKAEREKQARILATQKAEAEAEKKKQARILAEQQAKAEKEKKALEEKIRKEDAARLEREEQIKALAKQKAEAIKEKLSAEARQKQLQAELLKRQVECPFCHKKFVPKEKEVAK